MTAGVPTTQDALPARATSAPAPGGDGARISLAGAGVRFEFDRLRRVTTPALRRIRRIHARAWGLRGVTLAVEPGEAVAVVGATGSGKTTLLRVIAGVIPPDEGGAEVRGQVGALLATGAGVQMFLTGRENAELLGVLAGLSFREVRDRMEAIAERAKLGDAFDRPVHTYSEGMRARLGFAVIQMIETRVLLLDEVFEALDHEFRAKVEAYGRDLRSRGGIVVAAGHDHAALERLCPRALWLAGGQVEADGPFAEVVAAYRAAGPPATAGAGDSGSSA
jgi:ABC-type polysaccharide/polyol phosphate transport system ATPase subunit